MLSGRHFYHRTIRKNVVVFGNLFNEITLVRYDKNTYNEVERFKVPLVYSGKENFITRFLSRPNLDATESQIVLPRMSFEMTSIEYDVSRKRSNYGDTFSKIEGSTTTVSKIPSPVPYNINFELVVYVRNVEDGTQIVEQILPTFNPDYTLTMSFIDGADVKNDVPVILNDINYNVNYEGPDVTPRILTWTLNFTMKTYFYGYVNKDAKIIRKATANTYNIENNSQYVYQTVVPDPIDAEIDDDYGFTETIVETFDI